MRTLLWSYLGWRRFPREMSAFELRQFSTFEDAARRQLRRRCRSRARLGAALQLGFVRMTGTTLDAFDHVPRAVLEHVGRQLAIAAPDLTTLRALYRRGRTVFDHRMWACQFAGFRWAEAEDVSAVIDALWPVLSSPSTGTVLRGRRARSCLRERS